MRELRSSWALIELTPFELYVKVLIELVRDRLEHPLQDMPSDFPPLADFQWAAVQTALRILKRQNGIILGDVVGFGKTLMGAAMLKWLHARERWRGLRKGTSCGFAGVRLRKCNTKSSRRAEPTQGSASILIRSARDRSITDQCRDLSTVARPTYRIARLTG